MHSWRALLLEFVASPDRNYDFNEPWDGPNNIKLAEKIPTFLICQSDHDHYKPSTTFTSYVLITGPGTGFPGAQSTQFADFKDGLNTTIVAAEVADSGVIWTEPRDLDVRSMSFVIDDPTRPCIRSKHGGPNVLFADGTRERLDPAVFPNLSPNGSKAQVDPKILRAMTTIQGGESLDSSTLFKYKQ